MNKIPANRKILYILIFVVLLIAAGFLYDYLMMKINEGAGLKKGAEEFSEITLTSEYIIYKWLLAGGHILFNYLISCFIVFVIYERKDFVLLVTALYFFSVIIAGILVLAGTLSGYIRLTFEYGQGMIWFLRTPIPVTALLLVVLLFDKKN